MTEPTVYDRKSVYMQRCGDFVRAGYRFWAAGEVRPERVRALTKKFARLYGTDQTRHQRAYARAHGEGCAVLLLYAPHAGTSAPPTAEACPHTARPAPFVADAAVTAPYAGTPCRDTANNDPHAARATPAGARITPHTAMNRPPVALRWILLVTPGDHPAHQLEHLREAHDAAGRIVITGYELVQLPRPGQVKPAWTWRMDDATYQGWRLRLIAAARRRSTLLTAEVAQLARTPGFAGCRAQAKKLMHLAAGEWRRRYSDEAPMVVPRLPYVQRLPDGGTSLSVWVRRYTRQTSCAVNTGVDAPATES